MLVYGNVNVMLTHDCQWFFFSLLFSAKKSDGMRCCTSIESDSLKYINANLTPEVADVFVLVSNKFRTLSTFLLVAIKILKSKAPTIFFLLQLKTIKINNFNNIALFVDYSFLVLYWNTRHKNYLSVKCLPDDKRESSILYLHLHAISSSTIIISGDCEWCCRTHGQQNKNSASAFSFSEFKCVAQVQICVAPDSLNEAVTDLIDFQHLKKVNYSLLAF